MGFNPLRLLVSVMLQSHIWAALMQVYCESARFVDNMVQTHCIM
jgi:hypothetical protein